MESESDNQATATGSSPELTSGGDHYLVGTVNSTRDIVLRCDSYKLEDYQFYVREIKAFKSKNRKQPPVVISKFDIFDRLDWSYNRGGSFSDDKELTMEVTGAIGMQVSLDLATELSEGYYFEYTLYFAEDGDSEPLSQDLIEVVESDRFTLTDVEILDDEPF